MKLTKQFIIVYDGKNIIYTSTNNTETIVGKGRKSAEFDSLEELETFISDNQLKEDGYSTEDNW